MMRSEAEVREVLSTLRFMLETSQNAGNYNALRTVAILEMCLMWIVKAPSGFEQLVDGLHKVEGMHNGG